MKKVEIVHNMPARNSQPKIRRRKSKSYNIPLLIGILVVVFVGVILVSSFLGGNPGKNRVLLRTSKGDIIIKLYNGMPITVGNFKNLVQNGVYDNNTFHRVIDGFMIQGGRDPSIPPIADEFLNTNSNDRGTIAMANAGANTGTSQFFINLVDNHDLNPKHPVFGEVVQGMDVVDRIGKVETDESDEPLVEVRLIRAELID
jgi:peptidylprolyl isomerase